MDFSNKILKLLLRVYMLFGYIDIAAFIVQYTVLIIFWVSQCIQKCIYLWTGVIVFVDFGRS